MQNPFNVSPQDDLLTDLAGAPAGFTENMFFQAGDSTGNGIWLHVATAPTDPGLWRSLVAIYQPDGVVLTGRSFGRPRDRRGPATGELQIRCEEEHRRWSIRFDGGLERTDRHRMATRLVGGGVAEPVKIDLSLDATSPVYDLFAAVAAPKQDWGGTHHEQAFAVSGAFTVGGAIQQFSGNGYRDHSTGSRDFTTLRGNNLMWGTFDDGLVFGHVDLLAPGQGVQISQSYLSRGGGLELAKCATEITLDGSDATPESGTVEIAGSGEALSFSWQVRNCAVFSAIGPNNWVLGCDTDDPDPLILTESPVTLLRSDGCQGVGHLERTRRRPALTLSSD